MSDQWYNPGEIGSKRKSLQENVPADSLGGGADIAAPNVGQIEMPKSDGGTSSPEMSGDNLQGKRNDSEENKSKNTSQEAPREQRRRMQFMQYMRKENAEDRKVLEEFVEMFDTPDGWKREEHLGDLRPSIWFRKDDYVVEVYATLGSIAAIFGTVPPVSENEKQDYTMMGIIFPPVKIPHIYEDDDTGEESEDFEQASDTLDAFIEECDDYVREQKALIEGEESKKTRKLSGFKKFGKEDK